MSKYSSFLGRVGKVADQVLQLFNDTRTNAGFISETNILTWINDCCADLAVAGYWKKYATLDVVANQAIYDIQAILPDAVFIHNMIFADRERSLFRFSDWEQLAYARKFVSPGEMIGVLVETGILHLIPTPTTTVDGGIQIYYSYQPPELGGGTEIALAATDAEVTDNEDGTVTLVTAADHDLNVGEIIAISGTTNYNGSFEVEEGSTGTTIVITATYVEETITASAKCGRLYTPLFPAAHDDVLVAFCLRQACLKDSGRRAALYDRYDAQYREARDNLLYHGRQLKLNVRPVR